MIVYYVTQWVTLAVRYCGMYFKLAVVCQKHYKREEIPMTFWICLTESDAQKAKEFFKGSVNFNYFAGNTFFGAMNPRYRYLIVHEERGEKKFAFENGMRWLQIIRNQLSGIEIWDIKVVINEISFDEFLLRLWRRKIQLEHAVNNAIRQLKKTRATSPQPGIAKIRRGLEKNRNAIVEV